jgi:histidinol-phosphate aminotransferase
MAYFRDNIEQMSGYVPGFQPRGEGIIKLNTNENPYPPSPAVMQAIASLGPERLRRYPQPLS